MSFSNKLNTNNVLYSLNVYINKYFIWYTICYFEDTYCCAVEYKTLSWKFGGDSRMSHGLLGM